MKKYTISGLPVLEETTIELFANEYYPLKAQETMQTMEKEDPLVMEVLKEMVNRLGSDLSEKERIKIREGFSGGFCAAYTLLRLQAAKNKD